MQTNIVFQFDKYTKIVLTVIALALLGIVFKLYFTPESAHANPVVMDVNLKYIDGRSISSGPIGVNLEKIDGRSISNNLPVDIRALDGRNLSGNLIPVDIKMVNSNSLYNNGLPVVINK